MIDCYWPFLSQEKRLTDSCVEMLSTQSRLSAKLRAQRTVCSACGPRGPPAHTPAPAKPQKGSRCVPAPFWHMQVKVRLHTLADSHLIVNSQLSLQCQSNFLINRNELLVGAGIFLHRGKIFKCLSYICSWFL